MRNPVAIPALAVLAAAVCACAAPVAAELGRRAAARHLHQRVEVAHRPAAGRRGRHAPDRRPPARRSTRRRRRCGCKYWEDVLQRARGDHRAPASPRREQLNYDIYRAQIAVLIADQRFRDFEMPANSDTTFWTDIGYTARRPFRTLRTTSNWIAQMQRHPALLPRADGRDARGPEARLHAAAVTMQGRDASITAVTEATPEDSLFYTPFKEMPGIAAGASRRALRAEAVKTIRDVVQPAYAELLQVHAHRVRAGHAARRSPPRTCRTARPTTAPRSASSRRSTWSRTRSTQLGVGRSGSGCTQQMLAAMQETGFKGDFAGVPASSCAPIRSSTRRRPRSC